ncbi:ABC transporter ATP-binding protein [Pararhizobium haloflavum]|uniref:ABC transporter ATP-binding protein n=1 Tax=Pararhizobium haloflavum TaxID=2037914 RepID=UPI000C1842B3|nr:ABC transporter ATP-binding protein [Pararhizobium haloflavum]
MLEARNLHKAFGQVRVTNDVSIAVEKGERRVVLGPNGAGKTTLFNILVGELSPTSGTIRLGGEDVTGHSVEARAKRGLARSYQKNNLFNDLTIRDNLALAIATATGAASRMGDTLRDPAIVERIEEVAARVNLRELLDQPVDSVSYGARRQLEVGLALATNPRVLLMDEPTSGVGPEMIRAFHDLLKSLPRDLTVLIIEHDMDLAFDVADQVTVLNYGEVVFEGTPGDTRESSLVNEIYLGGSVDA